MKVLAAVAPAADVDASDVAEPSHCPLDARLQQAELLGHLVLEVAGIAIVAARLEQKDQGEARRFLERQEAPPLAGPEVVGIGSLAVEAIDPAGTCARNLF
ncbi:MAG TPA: hypothetical protein VJQ08_09700 [Candidatus Dormibacteraeota bacterium]|nr:hypothetical protein [Candidatus Dormibacteraeota bacterium]